jgi:hypothetical protein
LSYNKFSLFRNLNINANISYNKKIKSFNIELRNVITEKTSENGKFRYDVSAKTASPLLVKQRTRSALNAVVIEVVYSSDISEEKAGDCSIDLILRLDVVSLQREIESSGQLSDKQVLSLAKDWLSKKARFECFGGQQYKLVKDSLKAKSEGCKKPCIQTEFKFDDEQAPIRTKKRPVSRVQTSREIHKKKPFTGSFYKNIINSFSLH